MLRAAVASCWLARSRAHAAQAPADAAPACKPPARQAISLTAPEVSVLEAALNEVHGMMRGKRSAVHALEEDLEAQNPDVFVSVQVRMGLHGAAWACMGLHGLAWGCMGARVLLDCCMRQLQ